MKKLLAILVAGTFAVSAFAAGSAPSEDASGSVAATSTMTQKGETAPVAASGSTTSKHHSKHHHHKHHKKAASA